MSFYRIYRPQTIAEIDNVSVREALLRILSKEKKDWPHAFLFTGPRGAGKTTAARVVAKMFNCQKLDHDGPCGQCDQCASIAQGNNLDILEIDAASNRGIDEIRELRGGIALAPVSGLYKIFIIDEVHMLTTEAFNALLKTLEEPPIHAVFVLATTDVAKVPETIKSRCIGIIFSKAKIQEILHAIKRITKKEKINIDEDALELIAASTDGAFRDAVKFLEQASFYKGKITKEVAENILSIPTNQLVAEFISFLLQHKTKDCLMMVEDMVAEGTDIKTFLVQVLANLEKMLILGAKGEKPFSDEIQDLKESIHKLIAAYGEMRLSPILQLPLELAVVELGEKRSNLENTDRQPVATPKGMVTLSKLEEYWPDFIAAVKTYNNSIAGVLRSSRPTAVEDGIVTLTAFYKFHQEKLGEGKTREILSDVIKKLFGERVKVEVILGKKEDHD